VIWRYMLM